MVRQPVIPRNDEKARRPIPIDIDYASRLTVGFKLNAAGLEAALCDLSTAPLRTISPDPRYPA